MEVGEIGLVGFVGGGLGVRGGLPEAGLVEEVLRLFGVLGLGLVTGEEHPVHVVVFLGVFTAEEKVVLRVLIPEAVFDQLRPLLLN